MAYKKIRMESMSPFNGLDWIVAMDEGLLAKEGLEVEISVRYAGQTVNGRSVLDLLTLGAAQGSVLQVRISGIDAKAAHAALTAVVEHRFYEE